MKNIRKLFTLLLILTLMLTTAFIPVSAKASGITDFSVISSIGESKIEVRWWKSNENYYLFMPSDSDLSSLTVRYTSTAEVFLEGTALANGDAVSLFENTLYTLSCDGNTYNLYLLKSQGLPSLHITTESGSMDAVHADKSHKEPASITVSSAGEIILEKELEYIKGRGNATWSYQKKPYNIKFNKKTSLFGMDKAKKWTLLANCVDETLMRNYTAYGLAAQLSIPFTTEHTFVDLYINNEYYGNYLLCESVEVGDGRVEITDLNDANEESNPDIDIEESTLGGYHEADFRKLKADTQKWVNIPVNPENISGGYLLEYELPDRYVNEVSGFVTRRNQTIVIKEPEYASEAQVKYISALYQQFEDAIYSDSGYNSLGKHYSEYIDFDSFVKMYVFQEFTKNLDAAITSFYIYKDTDSDKFIAAPVWDFDMALGKNYNRFGMNIATPDGWWAGIIYHWTDNEINTLPTMLNALYRHTDFFDAACEEWKNEFSPAITEEYIAELSAFSEALAPSAVMNAIRWRAYNTSDYDKVKELYINDVNANLLQFITGRKNFLDKGFSNTSVRVFFNANGGRGNMFNESAPQINDEFTLPLCTFTNPGYTFVGWNTAADGSGDSYAQGDIIILSEAKLELFAMWEEPSSQTPEEPEAPSCDHMCHKSGFSGFIWKLVKVIYKLFRINQVCECGAIHY